MADHLNWVLCLADHYLNGMDSNQLGNSGPIHRKSLTRIIRFALAETNLGLFKIHLMPDMAYELFFAVKVWSFFKPQFCRKVALFINLLAPQLYKERVIT